MVDAIAVASQREVEAHESAIALARENEELRLKLNVLIDDNNKLIELYESAIAEGANNVAVGCKFVQTEGQDETSSEHNENRVEESNCEFHDSEIKDIENLQHQLHDLHEENEKLMGLYEEAMKERDEFKRILASMETKVSPTKEEISCPEKLVEMDEEMGHQKQEPANPKEDLARMPEKMPQPVRENLELVRDKLAAVRNAVVKYLGVLERNITEVNELSENAIQLDHGVKFKQQEQMELEVGLSQLQERKTILENKFVALKLALQSFSSKANYWEQREGRARTRLNVCSEHVQRKKEELTTCLLAGKGEINTALAKAQQSESVLRCNIDHLKSKLHEIETLRQKTERVLFAIDNVENADMSVSKPINFGKAFELLKSEEEKSKLSAELKRQQEQLAILKKEIASLVKKTEATDADVKNAETSVKNGLLSLQQAEAALQQMMEEKKMLYDLQEDGKSEIGNLLLEFQNCIFNLDLKEGEIILHKETMEHDLRTLEQIRSKQDLATERLNQSLNADRHVTALSDIKDYSLNVSEMEQNLRDVQMYLDEIIYH